MYLGWYQLEINYKTNRLKKECEDPKISRKTYGDDIARKIRQRLNEIKHIDTVEEMIQFRLGRCHKLSGDRNNQYAVDLVHPFRMIFIKDKMNKSVQVVKIIEITDYH